MRAGLGISTAPDPVDALREAAGRARCGVGKGRVDAALVVTGPTSPADLARLPGAAAAALGPGAVVGATAASLHAHGEERTGGGTTAVLALAGVGAGATLAPAPPAASPAVWADALRAALGLRASESDLVLALPDPAGAAPAAVAAALAPLASETTLVGAAAGGRTSAVWTATGALPGGIALLRASLPTVPCVALVPTCRAIGAPREVTRVRGHWLLSLDGRPALDVYREAARGRLAEDPSRATDVVLLAVERPARDGGAPAEWLVRRVAGVDERRRALALAEPPRRGARVRFALRDADTARRALREAIERLGKGAAPAAVLHFACAAAAGPRLHGVAGLEAAYLERAFAPAPVLGMRGAWQIAPVAGALEVLTYADVLVALPA